MGAGVGWIAGIALGVPENRKTDDHATVRNMFVNKLGDYNQDQKQMQPEKIGQDQGCLVYISFRRLLN